MQHTVPAISSIRSPHQNTVIHGNGYAEPSNSPSSSHMRMQCDYAVSSGWTCGYRSLTRLRAHIVSVHGSNSLGHLGHPDLTF